MTALTAVLVLAGLATVGGALVAVTGRDVRRALAGLVVSMAAASLIADPPPTLTAVAARIVATLLGGYLLFSALRAGPTLTRGSLAGRPAELLAATAACVIGFGSSGLGAPALGPPLAQGVGFALLVLAIGPILRAADVFRLGVGLALLLSGVALVRVSLAGTPGPLEQLTLAGLTVSLLGGIGLLCAGAVSQTGSLVMEDLPGKKAHFDAHPIVATDGASGRHRPASRMDARTGAHRLADPGHDRPGSPDAAGHDQDGQP